MNNELLTQCIGQTKILSLPTVQVTILYGGLLPKH